MSGSWQCKAKGVFQGGGSPEYLASNLIRSPAPTSTPSSDPDSGIYREVGRFRAFVALDWLFCYKYNITQPREREQFRGRCWRIGRPLLMLLQMRSWGRTEFCECQRASLKNDEHSGLSFWPWEAISRSGVFTTSSWCCALALEAALPDSCLPLPG